MLKLPLYIAHRLSLRSNSRESQTGVVIAVSGITLAVVVMIVSISVMCGFKNEIKAKITGFDSQIVVAPHSGQSDDAPPTLSVNELRPMLDSLPPGTRWSLTARQPAIVKTPENFSGVIVKGMEPDGEWDFVRRNLVDGAVPDFSADSILYHVVVSHTLASGLNLSVGQKADVYFVGNGSYRIRRIMIAGIYDTHFAEYDKNVVFASLPMLRGVADIASDQGAMLEINGLGSDEEIDRQSVAISSMLMSGFYSGNTSRTYMVVNLHESAALYFNWLALLDTNVVVILSLMAILAGLTLVSSLFILVLRRVRTIGILKALGASNQMVRQTFILLTLRLLVAGLVIGNAVGLGLVYLQRLTRIVPLDPEAYYLDHVPVEISWPSVIMLNIAAALIAFAVLLFPSAIIATIKPARVINYE